MHVIVCK